jgi:hypothetical protein
LDNGKTKERLLTKMEEADPNLERDKILLLISRYPLASQKKWIVGKRICQKRICLSKELKVVPI